MRVSGDCFGVTNNAAAGALTCNLPGGLECGDEWGQNCLRSMSALAGTAHIGSIQGWHTSIPGYYRGHIVHFLSLIQCAITPFSPV